MMRGISVAWMLAFILGSVGCRGIYHQTRALLPPEPCAQLELRVQEACDSEKAAEKASMTLRVRLAEGRPYDAIATDLDRLEAAARELERRVASARDAATRCREPEQLEAEIERLHLRARDLLDRVESVRRRDVSTNASLAGFGSAPLAAQPTERPQ